MNLSDVNTTVKTAFCNTQVAEAFAAAVVESSMQRDSTVKVGYDFEIQKLTNELEAIKGTLSEIEKHVFSVSSVTQSVDSENAENGTAIQQVDIKENRVRSNDFEALQRCIYEHFRKQAGLETRISELESSIIREGEILSLKKDEISTIGKNLEKSTEQITTLVYLIETQKNEINNLNARIKGLESKINNLDEIVGVNCKISENIASLPKSIMDVFQSQTKSWESFSKVLSQVSREIDFIMEKNAGTFEENGGVDELAGVLRVLVSAMMNMKPIICTNTGTD